MNKEEIEEIEEIKRLLFQDRLTQYGKRKLVQHLEQKESILDKVTDKLKEDIRNDYCIKEIIGDAYITTGVEEYSVKPYAQEILNIIEGEKDKLNSIEQKWTVK